METAKIEYRNYREQLRVHEWACELDHTQPTTRREYSQPEYIITQHWFYWTLLQPLKGLIAEYQHKCAKIRKCMKVRIQTTNNMYNLYYKDRTVCLCHERKARYTSHNHATCDCEATIAWSAIHRATIKAWLWFVWLRYNASTEINVVTKN